MANKYAYADIQSFKESLIIFTSPSLLKKTRMADAEPGTGTNGTTILMSRTDFNVKIVPVPPIPDDQIENMLRYKIRGLYPGDPALTAFDYRILSFGGARYAMLFITRRNVLESYEHLGTGTRLILPYTLMKKAIGAARTPNAFFLFWHRHWVEVFSIVDGVPVSSNAVKRARTLKSDLQKIKKILPAYQGETAVTVFSEEAEAARITEGLAPLFPGAAISARTFEDALQADAAGKDALFRKKKSLPLPPLSRRLAFYGASIGFLLLALFLWRSVDHLYRYRDHLTELQSSLSRRNTQLSGILNDVKALEAEYAVLERDRPVDIYRLLSDLAGVFPADTVIQSLVIKNDRFQLDGIGSGPLLVEEKLKDHPAFREIEMTEMKPVPGSGRQFFRMKGVFLNEKTQPE
ncbi:MAG TPA: hypothetical protein ENN69_06220 [Spirochaetia bacterium]|nr:hypothetical protein [Spirochaetia bacterium]